MKSLQRFYVLFCLFSTICFSCCKTTAQTNTAAANSAGNIRPDPITQEYHLNLSENDIGKTFTITGILNNDETRGWSVLENPESRSRVTFYMSVPDNLTAACKSLKGSYVCVTGILTSSKSPWTNYLQVKEIKPYKAAEK